MALLERADTLAAIREKLETGERLDFDDGVTLMESDDILALGELADLARRLRGGDDRVYFVQNLYLNQTNVCRVKCKFCAFAVTQKQDDAYTYSGSELVEDAVRQHELTGFTEIHMVGGETPHVGFDYYVDIVRSLHEALPDVHLKLFTASEIHHMTKLSGLSHEEVLRELKAVGLGSLPGGGAEVFADRVRRLVAPGKEHPDFWFRTHDAAHRLGIPTHCTMLYGHVETYEERVDRLRRPEDDRGVAPAARQHRERQGVLDHDGPAACPGGAPFRRERRAGHGRARADLSRRRRAYRDRAENPGARAFRARGRADPGAARHALQRGGAMVRLGRISYVNMAPVFYRLDAEVEEIQGVPTELNRRVLAGELDVAPISSIEYARNADRLRLLPRLCVSSEGAVDSIQLVSRKPLEQVRSVAVTPESATSVVLTKVLLPEASHVPLGEDADAKLLIGDAALKSAFEDPTPHYDLGRLWLERTGLPMVFAVWACPEPLHAGLAELEDALVASVRLARAEPEQLAYEASERYGYPAGFLARYFEKLRYRFGPRERAGLMTFLELAQETGELGEVPELRFVREAVVA